MMNFLALCLVVTFGGYGVRIKLTSKNAKKVLADAFNVSRPQVGHQARQQASALFGRFGQGLIDFQEKILTVAIYESEDPDDLTYADGFTPDESRFMEELEQDIVGLGIRCKRLSQMLRQRM